MTPETAQFLLDLVNGITLQVGAPNFDEAVARLQEVRGELVAILEPPTDKKAA